MGATAASAAKPIDRKNFSRRLRPMFFDVSMSGLAFTSGQCPLTNLVSLLDFIHRIGGPYMLVFNERRNRIFFRLEQLQYVANRRIALAPRHAGAIFLGLRLV